MTFDCRRWIASACLIAPVAVLCACGPTDTYLNDTWTWSGGDWHQVSTNQGPGWRFGAVFVYDEATNQVVMFGGEDAGNRVLSDTWTWDGHWTQRHPASSPPARLWPAAAYDPVRRNVVMFGGDRPGYGELGDTWVWDGDTWSQISPAQSPPAQGFGPSAAAFDPISSRVILVGCWFGCSGFDTWSWDGERWRVHSAGTAHPTGPIYLDSIRGHVIRVGGLWWLSGRDSLEWSGASWEPSTAPSFGSGSAGGIAYDRQASELVVFGGDSCNPSQSKPSLDETWTKYGDAWHLLTPRSRPPARTETYMAYDSSISRVVMFGGWSHAQCSSPGPLP